MKKIWILLMMLSGLLLLAACGEAESPIETAEEETPVETAVSPTASGEREVVPLGRYSFQPMDGYEWDITGGQMFMGDQDGTVMMSLIGVPANDNTPEEIMADFIDGMAVAGSGTLAQGEESAIVVDGVDGTAVVITGDLFGSPMEGEAVLVQPTDDWAIFALAMGNVSEDDGTWSDNGQVMFTTLIDSVTFLDETAVAELLSDMPVDGLCPIATDTTYGYSKDNPIQVGGDAMDGPPRERAYLDNLVDPVGIPVTYTRVGSEPYGETILDIYEIISPMADEPINLYIDEYSYSELMAPAGFDCVAPFSITAP